MDPIANTLATLNGGRVLDVATGRGNFVRLLLQYLPGISELVGIDTNDAPFKSAAEQINDLRLNFQKMDAACLDFAGASFDTVAISFSLHHLVDLPKVLQEMIRVLKPGGAMIVSEMYSDGTQTETQQTHVLLHHWWGAVDSARGVCHQPTFTRQEIIDLISRLGLCDLMIFDDADLTSDPLEPALIAELTRTIDHYETRLPGLPDEADLRDRGEELRKRVNTVGFHSATVLFAVGKKPLN